MELHRRQCNDYFDVYTIWVLFSHSLICMYIHVAPQQISYHPLNRQFSIHFPHYCNGEMHLIPILINGPYLVALYD